MKNQALIIGGSNGIGLAITLELSKIYDTIYVVDKVKPNIAAKNVHFQSINLLMDDFSWLEYYKDIDTLIYTAGFGRVAPFETIIDAEIKNQFQVNIVSVTRILRFYYKRMQSTEPFYCTIMGSIAGLVSSPLFALYGATKAGICKLIESLNIELEASGTKNRILNVSPGSIKGTRFNGGENDISLTKDLAQDIIHHMKNCETVFIPDYDSIFKGVLERYATDSHTFGIDSYQYKINAGRINFKPQVKIGYLSGTFDLFHIGHLNLLYHAKQHCDYLVVGVHKDASHKGKEVFIPLEERMEIVRNIKYVDQVITSEPEDCDVYIKNIIKYDLLFVGSDYKGTERFNRYEEYFADKGVKIIYFPYTQGTSSTQLRNYLLKH